jgi:DNA-binding Lrp family transcriptional regulator
MDWIYRDDRPQQGEKVGSDRQYVRLSGEVLTVCGISPSEYTLCMRLFSCFDGETLSLSKICDRFSTDCKKTLHRTTVRRMLKHLMELGIVREEHVLSNGQVIPVYSVIRPIKLKKSEWENSIVYRRVLFDKRLSMLAICIHSLMYLRREDVPGMNELFKIAHKRFGCSERKVRQAVTELVALGLVIRYQASDISYRDGRRFAEFGMDVFENYPSKTDYDAAVSDASNYQYTVFRGLHFGDDADVESDELATTFVVSSNADDVTDASESLCLSNVSASLGDAVDAAEQYRKEIDFTGNPSRMKDTLIKNHESTSHFTGKTEKQHSGVVQNSVVDETCTNQVVFDSTGSPGMAVTDTGVDANLTTSVERRDRVIPIDEYGSSVLSERIDAVPKFFEPILLANGKTIYRLLKMDRGRQIYEDYCQHQ